jgi:hypothetical protein
MRVFASLSGEQDLTQYDRLRLPPRIELAVADGLAAFLQVVNDYRHGAGLGLNE